MTVEMFDSTSIGIGKGREGGYACVAPAGTDPTAFEDMTKTLKELCEATSSVLKPLGYINEDGVTISTDTDTDDKVDWAGNLIASPLTSYAESIQVSFLQSDATVLGTIYGASNVTTAKGITTVRHNKNFVADRLYVFDSVISDTKVKRTIVPKGVISERDDVQYNNSDLVAYTPTIKCLSAACYDGDTIREFIYDTTTGTTKAA